MSNTRNGNEPTKAIASVPLPARPLRPSTPTQGLTPQFVLCVLLRWWKIATPLGLLLAVIATGYVYWSFEPVYQASNLFQIKGSRPYLVYGERGGGGGSFINTQISLMYDTMVLASVARDLADVPEIKKAEDPVKWLSENIRVGSVRGSELYTISATTSDKKDCADIVNAVFDAYYLLLGQEGADLNQDIIETLVVEKAKREEEVKRLQGVVRDMNVQVTGTDPFMAGGAAKFAIEFPLADLHSRLVSAEVEEEYQLANIAVLEKRIAEGLPEAPSMWTEEAVDQDGQVLQLQAQIAYNQATLSDMELRLVAPTEDERFKDLQRVVHEDEQLLEKVRGDARERIGARAALSQTSRYEAALTAMRDNLETGRFTKTLLRERYEEKLKEAGIAGGDTVDLGFATRELNEAQDVFNALSNRILRLTTEQDAPDQVKWWRNAEPAIAPVETVPTRNLALASLVFFVPFALAGAWEFFVRRVSGSQQLEGSSNVTVIAEIARLPVRTKIGHNDSKKRVDFALTVFEESIDTLRTHLMLSETFQKMQVLAVTSAAAEEGKTSVAAQLAVNIAWVSGKRTLLIDGDMRSPDIHTVFGITPEVGLAEVLAGKCSVEDAIVKSKSNYADVLPAGELRTSPHRLLGNGALEALLKEVRSKYDYVIIDTPPILAASEAIVLAKAADRSVMCAMQDLSRIDQIVKAHDRMTAAGAEPAGIILNGVPALQYGYRYGSYAYKRG